LSKLKAKSGNWILTRNVPFLITIIIMIIIMYI